MIAVEAAKVIAQGAAKVIAQGAAKLIAPIGPTGRRWGCNSKIRCKDRDRKKTKDWVDVPAADTLWNTARDGEIVLGTTGDGVFTRE